MRKKIAVLAGDGIGPEIMQATLRILNAAGAKIEIHKIETNFEEDRAAFLAARELYPYIKKVEKMEREKWQNSLK